MPKKRTAALFDRICLESVKPLCFIRVRVGHIWLFSSNMHIKKAYRIVVYFERACQEGVHLHIFDKLGAHVTTTLKHTVLQILCLTFARR